MAKSKFKTLLESTLVRYQRSPFLTGDQVTFIDKWNHHPWIKQNPDYALRINEWIKSGDFIRVSATKAIHPGQYGNMGNPGNEIAEYVDITLEPTPGRWSGVLTVPGSLIQAVTTDPFANLSGVPEGRHRKDTSQIKPTPHEFSKDTSNPYGQEKETGTGEKTGDRTLLNKNAKIEFGNKKKWAGKDAGSRKNDWAKLNESYTPKKSEADLIFEAYMDANTLEVPVNAAPATEFCPGCGAEPGLGDPTCNDPNGCGLHKDMQAEQDSVPVQSYEYRNHKVEIFHIGPTGLNEYQATIDGEAVVETEAPDVELAVARAKTYIDLESETKDFDIEDDVPIAPAPEELAPLPVEPPINAAGHTPGDEIPMVTDTGGSHMGTAMYTSGF